MSTVLTHRARGLARRQRREALRASQAERAQLMAAVLGSDWRTPTNVLLDLGAPQTSPSWSAVQPDRRDQAEVVEARRRDGDMCRVCGVVVQWRGPKTWRSAELTLVEDVLVVLCRGCSESRANWALMPPPGAPFYSTSTRRWLEASGVRAVEEETTAMEGSLDLRSGDLPLGSLEEVGAVDEGERAAGTEWQHDPADCRLDIHDDERPSSAEDGQDGLLEDREVSVVHRVVVAGVPESAHRTSPSLDVRSSPSVGDGLVGVAPSAAPAGQHPSRRGERGRRARGIRGLFGRREPDLSTDLTQLERLWAKRTRRLR